MPDFPLLSGGGGSSIEVMTVYIYQGIRLPDSLPKKKYTISVSFSPTVIVCKAPRSTAGDLAAETLLVPTSRLIAELGRV